MKKDLIISEPLVLLIGSIDSESVKSTLKVSGRQYKIKRLESSVDNWKSIISYFEDYKVRCVVVKLSAYTYDLLANPQYASVRDKMLEQIANVPHAIFVYEELLLGRSLAIQDQSDEDERSYKLGYYTDFYYPTDEIRREVNNLLLNRELNILPYANNAELTVMAASYITDSEEGLLFRVYAPIGRMWANETERLIHLFQDYLSRVEKLPVRLDQHRTDRGIIYEFFSVTEIDRPASIREESLAAQFQKFSQLLDLSMSDPTQAEELLRSKHLDQREVLPILTRYAKEAKRLQIDLKHEREQKVLSSRQRCESELVDGLPPHTPLGVIAQLVDIAVPPLSGVSSALRGDQIPLQLNATSGSSITLNVHPRVNQIVNSVVAQEIQGDVHLTPTDRKLLELIREHAPDREQELGSAVRELADSSAPKPGRLLAKQKLKAFLVQVGSKTGEIAIGLFQSYLEKQIGLS